MAEVIRPRQRRKCKSANDETPRTHAACDSAQDVLKRVRGMVLLEMDGIVTALIAQAKKGKYLDAKFLFELAGISGLKPESEEPQLDGEALADRFLEHFAGLPRKEQQPDVEGANL